MKGTTLIHFNQATMIQAVEEYLAKRWSGERALAVQSVAFDDGGNDGDTFLVVVQAMPKDVIPFVEEKK